MKGLKSWKGMIINSLIKCIDIDPLFTLKNRPLATASLQDRLENSRGLNYRKFFPDFDNIDTGPYVCVSSLTLIGFTFSIFIPSPLSLTHSGLFSPEICYVCVRSILAVPRLPSASLPFIVILSDSLPWLPILPLPSLRVFLLVFLNICLGHRHPPLSTASLSTFQIKYTVLFQKETDNRTA